MLVLANPMAGPAAVVGCQQTSGGAGSMPVSGPENRVKLGYVRTLPPHRGGSAVVAAQVLSGLADRGWRVRALAPRSPDLEGVPQSGLNTDVVVTSFEMPFAALKILPTR